MRKFVAIALSCCTVLAMAACKATPKTEIVKGKSLDKMIDLATSSTPSGANIAEKLGAQKTYTKELVDAKGKVTIHVNANVILPDAQGVSVKRVEPTMITQDQVNALKTQLVKGSLFSGDDYVMTKSEIQQKILALQADINKRGGSSAQPSPGNGSRDQAIIQSEQAQVQELQNQLAKAPDTHVKTPIDGQLKPDEDYGQKVYGLAQTDQWGYESFTVLNFSDNYGSMVEYTRQKNGFSRDMGYFSTKETIAETESWGGRPIVASSDISKIPDVTITKEQAIEKGNALIASLGITDMVCTTAEKEYGGSYDTVNGTMGAKLGGETPEYLNPRQCVWFLRFGRVVDKVPITYTVYDCIKTEDDQQSQPWPYEDMTFAIDDSGILGFSWRSPYKGTDTVTQNCSLASFADSMKVFESMALVVNAWDGYAEGNPNLTNIDITVNKIQFGLTRITEQNKRNSGLLVPCWDFIGTVNYVMTTNGQKKTMPDGPVPILTVNAIDGSIINRNLGY